MENLIRKMPFKVFSIKFCLAMRLTFFLFMVSVLTIQAAVNAQNVRVTFKLENVSMQSALERIESSTSYKFVYNNKKIDSEQMISIEAQNEPLSSVLNRLFQGRNISFNLRNRLIVLRPENTNRASSGSGVVLPRTAINEIQYQITGTVNDTDGQPLPGANIIEKGTTNGTQTNFDGNFTLNVTNEDAVIVISYIGFATKEIMLDGQNQITVTLKEDAAGLDEVVVVGYGTQSVKKVTQAVTQVNAEDLDIEKRPVTNLQNALVGSAPGLIINQNSGQLGDEIDIRVRESSAIPSGGDTTIDRERQSNALVLIDGFPGSINDINPNDIASVSVLKDAAATAIYGARGANGVVLVTTKNTRKNERLSLNYNYSVSFQSPAQTPELLNSENFIEFSNEAAENEGLRNGVDPASITLPFDQDALTRARNGFYPDTDWIAELYSQTATLASHNIGINGGSEKTGYSIGLGLIDQEGVLVGPDNLKRYNLRVKIDTDITDWLEVGVNASYTHQLTNRVPNLEGNSSRGRPFFPVRLPDGRFVDKGAAVGEPNPIGAALSGSFDKLERDALNLQLYGSLKLLRNLKLQHTLSIIRNNNFRRDWSNPYAFTILNEEDLSEIGTVEPLSSNRRLLLLANNAYSINNLTTLNYNYSLNNAHNFEALVGLQTNEGEFQEVQATRINFALDDPQDLSLGLESVGLGNESSRLYDRATISYFGRLAYDFKSKYLLSVSFRNDESSNFGPANRSGFFPAASLGWNIDQENFLKDSFFTGLKLRASWGQSGDDRNTNFIENAILSPLGASLGGVEVPTIRLGDAIDPNIKWETSEKTNIALDFDLWNRKFGGTIEYYQDKRSDILTQLRTAIEGGIGGILSNVYDARSFGWEISAYHNNTIGEVSYFTNANLTFYDSEITDLRGVGPITRNRDYQDVGLPILGNWFGYETDGFFDDQQEIDTFVDESGNPIDQSAVGGSNIGSFKYVDQITDIDEDGDGIPDRRGRDGIINADDRIVLKENTRDNYRIGFGLGVSYKGFSLSTRFYGVLRGYQWWNEFANLQPFVGDVASFAYQTDTWSPDNLNAIFPQVLSSNVLTYDQNVSHLIQKNAYIKMKNINLSYAFNDEILKKLKIIKGMSMYVSAENLGVIWTNNPAFDTGWDPEFPTGVFRYPLPLTIAFGTNINF